MPDYVSYLFLLKSEHSWFRWHMPVIIKGKMTKIQFLSHGSHVRCSLSPAAGGRHIEELG